MKVMLLKDVYKLGRAGEVKKVANGYGRNYLLPQGLAVLATPGALASSDRIGEDADRRRAILNEELGGLAAQLNGQTFTFPVRASETGKLYGSVTTRMIVSAVNEKLETDLSHRQIESQPLRSLGEYTFPIRLTIDLAPEITVIVFREGEGIESAYEDFEDEEEEVEEETAVMEMETVSETEEPNPEVEEDLDEDETGDEFEEDLDEDEAGDEFEEEPEL